MLLVDLLKRQDFAPTVIVTPFNGRSCCLISDIVDLDQGDVTAAITGYVGFSSSGALRSAKRAMT
jgi:hypothetical protein